MSAPRHRRDDDLLAVARATGVLRDTPIYDATTLAHELDVWRVRIDEALDRIAANQAMELLPEVEAHLRGGSS